MLPRILRWRATRSDYLKIIFGLSGISILSAVDELMEKHTKSNFYHQFNYNIGIFFTIPNLIFRLSEDAAYTLYTKDSGSQRLLNH